MLNICMALVTALPVLPAPTGSTGEPPVLPCTVGVGEAPTLADLTGANVDDGFGCTPCTSYAYIDVNYEDGPDYAVTLSVPGQQHQVDDQGEGFSLKFGLPSSQLVGWCNPNYQAGECTPMIPCPASFWGAFSGLGNGFWMVDLDHTGPGSNKTVAPSGQEMERDCGDQADFRMFEIWWSDDDDILNTQKRIATIIVAYGCNDCIKVEVPAGVGD